MSDRLGTSIAVSMTYIAAKVQQSKRQRWGLLIDKHFQAHIVCTGSCEKPGVIILVNVVRFSLRSCDGNWIYSVELGPDAMKNGR